VDSLQPINAAPPDLRDEMCGPHRKRPAAEDADDDGEASSFMLSNLPPSAGKASALLKEKPDTAQAIAVFIGAAKSAAEAQFASARAKIQKLAKGKKADPKAVPATQAAAPAQTATDAKATAAVKPTASVPALQTATSPPADAFTQTPSQPQRAVRKLPAATDPSNPAMSYAAPAAKTEPAPLTAMPDAKDAKPAAAKAPGAKPKPKADAKPAADSKQTPKPAAPAKPAKQAAAPKQDATAKQ
jgi:D-alanyl-D-alanine carboxypeptidase